MIPLLIFIISLNVRHFTLNLIGHISTYRPNKNVCRSHKSLRWRHAHQGIHQFPQVADTDLTYTIVVGQLCDCTKEDNDWKYLMERIGNSLQWRHNGGYGISYHQPHDCLLNRLFRRRSKKTPKLRVTGLCAEKSPATSEFPHKGPVTREMFPFDDVIMS